MDLRFPLKKVLIMDHGEDNHILLSYEKLFKVFFLGEDLMDMYALIWKLIMAVS